jgi:hypothetical protein
MQTMMATAIKRQLASGFRKAQLKPLSVAA